MGYTKDDIVKELLKIKSEPKTKEPYVIDRRNYLIAILYYTFNVKEKELFTYTNLTSSSTINYAKRAAYNLYKIKDPLFLKNVNEFIKLYPAEFNDFDVKKREYNTTASTVSITLTHNQLASFSRYMQSKKIDKPEVAAKQLILSVLKLWEE